MATCPAPGLSPDDATQLPPTLRNVRRRHAANVGSAQTHLAPASLDPRGELTDLRILRNGMCGCHQTFSGASSAMLHSVFAVFRIVSPRSPLRHGTASYGIENGASGPWIFPASHPRPLNALAKRKGTLSFSRPLSSGTTLSLRRLPFGTSYEWIRTL